MQRMMTLIAPSMHTHRHALDWSAWLGVRGMELRRSTGLDCLRFPKRSLAIHFSQGDQVATKSTSGKGDAHQYLFRMWTSPNEVKGEFKYYQEGGGHGAANVALMTPDSTLNWCEDLSSEELSRAKFCLACSRYRYVDEV